MTARLALPCAVCGKRPGERGRGWRLARPDESGSNGGARPCEGCSPAAGKHGRPAAGGTAAGEGDDHG